MKFRFKPDDFNASLLSLTFKHTQIAVATRANEIIDMHLKTLPKLSGFRDSLNTEHYIFGSDKKGVDALTCYAFDIEPIEIKKCEHDRVSFILADALNNENIIKCVYCGKILKPKNGWTEA